VSTIKQGSNESSFHDPTLILKKYHGYGNSATSRSKDAMVYLKGPFPGIVQFL